MKRPLNWRELVLLYAASILEEFHEPELAKALRDFRVPMVDGGGMKWAHRRSLNHPWEIEKGSWQQAGAPEGNDQMVLLPLPAQLWEPPKRCDCSCRHQRRAG